ncbi:hypothetical protein BDN70DRAFT_379993 [Pholiota conissans]|uniref:PIN domain-containing protein n=1 Tax=Pholiota conissans TaxID=109636 RepID=A0A9P6D3W1_9AGAR|nr:hypothetical protein BDN70DRAFT_379993 [Pholiota conissans]
MAMSRALGAAFLNHQVEQLEKTVSSNGPASGNWRDRKTTTSPVPRRGANPPAPGVKLQPKKTPAKDRKDREFDRGVITHHHRISEDRKERDADVVVVDASVLIHALYQVKKWCRDGREEIIIVPLEALNTLDLLKKGTSSLAQKARAASRILEAQVGTNPRIRVQRDDAFVLWDKISFEEDPKLVATCPEWVRRIICCARWETENAEEELKPVTKDHPLKAVLAILSVAPNTSSPHEGSMTAGTPLTPVPLPAPSAVHGNRFEQRSTGTLVSSWAAKSGIEILEIDPALPGRGGEHTEEDRPKRNNGNSRGRRPSASDHGPKSGLVERPPAVMAMMEMVSQPTKVRLLARGEKLDPDP